MLHGGNKPTLIYFPSPAFTEAVLKECGCDFDAVVKTTVFLTDLNDFAAVKTLTVGSFR